MACQLPLPVDLNRLHLCMLVKVIYRMNRRINVELGNGFSFVTRQKRIHLDGDDFFVDLVFYNRLLQCFVLVQELEMPL